jgi:hypothetical protein
MQKGPIIAAFLTLIIIATQLAWGFRWAAFTEKLTDDSFHDDKYPSITQARDGKIWVVWEKDVNGYGVIYYTTSSDLGKHWSEPSNLTKVLDISDNVTPEVTQTNDGTIWVVWASNRPDAFFYDYEIYYRTSSNNGVTWSQIHQLTANSKPIDDLGPSITQAMNGTIYIAWSRFFQTLNSTEIVLTSSSNNGASWSPNPSTQPMRITNDGFFDASPSIIQTRDGRIWVAWETIRSSGDCDIYYRIYDGTGWLTEQKLPESTIQDDISPSLVGAANGLVWVFWDTGDIIADPPVPNNIYYSYTSDNGFKWERSALLSLPDGDINSSWSSATHTKDSTIWVVWASNRTGDYELYYRTSLTGDLTGPENPPGSGNYPSDGVVNQYDLAFVRKAYGTKEGDISWNQYNIADITGPINPPNTLWYPPDGVISVYDLTAIGKNYGKV